MDSIFARKKALRIKPGEESTYLTPHRLDLSTNPDDKRETEDIVLRTIVGESAIHEFLAEVDRRSGIPHDIADIATWHDDIRSAAREKPPQVQRKP